ncbi:hypothetical protein CP10139811_0967 [Chlamydia ibidis]|uniref:Uncharacterized protein n=1 Tax=Chlamydia ibidis TaxID=1405396 RepID=S7J4T4_9CHLA|nr:hypothetical protein CP10139811_0967 [Chlamydia ibidis]
MYPHLPKISNVQVCFLTYKQHITEKLAEPTELKIYPQPKNRDIQ